MFEKLKQPFGNFIVGTTGEWTILANESLLSVSYMFCVFAICYNSGTGCF